jgi:FSR family fosmidomycin resistance protein-like MFS transporter
MIMKGRLKHFRTAPGVDLMNKFNIRILLILSLGHCITDLYQGSMPVILPFLKAKLDLSYTAAGLILICSNLSSSIVQPIFGYYSDRQAKPWLLPAGCVCAGLGFSLMALTSDFALLLALVLLSGLGVAAYHPEGFKTASFFTGNRPAAAMSIFSMGGNLGFALAPILSLLVIKHYGLDYLPVLILLSVGFLPALFIFWKKIREAGRQVSGSVRETESPPPGGARIAMTILVSAVVMRAWTQFGLMSYVPFYYIDYLHDDPLFAGQLLTAFLACGAAGTLIGGQISDRIGHRKTLILSMASSSVILPFIFVTDGLLLVAVFALLGFCLVSSFAVTMVIAQKLMPHKVGMASGLTAGFAIGTGGAGVTVLGVIADFYGVPAAMECIMIFPVAGLILSLLLKAPQGYPKPS